MEILFCLAVGFFGAMLLSRLLHSADDGSRAKNLAVKLFGGGSSDPPQVHPTDAGGNGPYRPK